MIPSAFDYVVVESLEQALHALAQDADAKLLAGGHSLIPAMKLRLSAPSRLIDISRVRELRGIRVDHDTLIVGSLTTHHQVETSDEVRAAAPLLAQAAASIGDVQVRNRGTIGGSLAHADPAADYPAAVIALRASLTLAGPGGVRAVGVDDFFVDLLTTAVAPDEIVTEIRIPIPTGRCGGVYLKVPHPASGFAVVGVAAQVTLDGDLCSGVSVGVNGLAARPYRAASVERALTGTAPDPAAIAGAADHACDEGGEPMSDLYASGEFRQHLARVFTRRALEQAVRLARG